MVGWALLAATRAGVVRAAAEGGVWRAELVHPLERCSGIAAGGGAAYAGPRSGGVARSLDGGRTWAPAGLDGLIVTAIAASGEVVLAGTEPTAVYRSEDGGETWVELDAFRRIRSRRLWFFPGAPPFRAYVSGIAVVGGVYVVGIEAGAVVRSPDGGRTWQDHRPGALRDCHDLAADPAGRVHEAGGNGGGFATSADAGASWNRAPLEKGRTYAVAVATDGEQVYAASAPSPFKAHGQKPAEARIYRRDGAGWTALTPEWLAETPYGLAAPAPGLLFAGLRDGRILASEDAGGTLRELCCAPAGIRRLAVLRA
jgi:hypothetical protein